VTKPTRETLVNHFELGYVKGPYAQRWVEPATPLDSRPATGAYPPVLSRYDTVVGRPALHQAPSRGEPPPPGTALGRQYTSITAPVEERFEHERFRRAHYYPVSEAMQQGFRRPGLSNSEYYSARELRGDKGSHVRPILGPQEKYGYTARPPTSAAEHGWHLPLPDSANPPSTPMATTTPFSQLRVNNARRLSPMTRYMQAVLAGPRRC
jgi:hypothetical protein